MATTTQDTNRAKFLELRASGKSVADARNATYWPTPVVADQTPPVAITPTPTAPVGSWQVVTTPPSITPAPIVNAPVDQNTGLSKPLEPVAQPTQTPVAPVTPTNPVAQSQTAPKDRTKPEL